MFLAGYPAHDHRPCEEKLFRPQREVDMDQDHSNQQQCRKVMEHIDEAPGVLPEPVRISLPPGCIDLYQHQPARDYGRQDDHGKKMMDRLLGEGVFACQGWRYVTASERVLREPDTLTQIFKPDSHRTQIPPEQRSNHMNRDGGRHHDTRHPVHGHPGELDTEGRQKCRREENHGAHCGRPVQQTVWQRVSNEPVPAAPSGARG